MKIIGKIFFRFQTIIDVQLIFMLPSPSYGFLVFACEMTKTRVLLASCTFISSNNSELISHLMVNIAKNKDPRLTRMIQMFESENFNTVLSGMHKNSLLSNEMKLYTLYLIISGKKKILATTYKISSATVTILSKINTYSKKISDKKEYITLPRCATWFFFSIRYFT